MANEIITWTKNTAKTIFVIGCLSCIIAVTVSVTYIAKKYALPIVCNTRTQAIPTKEYTVKTNSKQCFHYVKEASKILPPTGDSDPSPEALLMGLITIESGGDPYAVSPTGAKGCGQIVTSLHPEVKEKVWDAEENVKYSAKFLAELVKKYGTYWDALPHYNGCVKENDCFGYRDQIFAYAMKYKEKPL